MTSSADEQVMWVAAGTVAVRASNRGLPSTELLSREQRKLAALADRRVQAIETVETPNKLYGWRPGRWSRINLGWHPDTGDVMGWYVNFEQPVVATSTGIRGKDLVLDLLIARTGSRVRRTRLTSMGPSTAESCQVSFAPPSLTRPTRCSTSSPRSRHVRPASVSFRPDPDWPYPLLARRSRDCKGVPGVIESL